MRIITVISLTVIFIAYFNKPVNAQTYVDSLTTNCKIYPDARWILRRNVCYQPVCTRMAEYKRQTETDRDSFQFEMLAIYQWEQSYLTSENIAATAWSLVSKQLTGNNGILTKSKGNFIPTKDQLGSPVLLVIVWQPTLYKWAIMSVPVSTVKAPKEGVHIIYKKV